MSSTLKGEARQFLETTSLRGVPRIVKSKNPVSCFFWLFGVLICSGLLIWQVTTLLERYYAYPINTQYVQAPTWNKPTFPDITVCNSNTAVTGKDLPFTYTQYVELMLRQMNKFLADSTNATTPQNSSTDQTNSLIALYLTPSFYFSNFPILANQAYSVSDSLIVQCGYFNWDYTSSVFEPCNFQIISRWNVDYYKCYTFRPIETERNNNRGFSAILYLDDLVEIQMSNFNFDLQTSYATGVQVVIHPAGTEPDLKLGWTISPGMDTTIILDQTIISRLPNPYSNCTTQKTLNDSKENTLDNDVTYSSDCCVEVCQQQKVINACHCFAGNLKYTEEQLQMTNYMVCGNLSLNYDNDSVNLERLGQFFNKSLVDKDGCETQCLVPCQEYQYSASTSAAPWPEIASQLSFFKTYI